MCILRDLPQQKNPRPLCWRSSPILYVPTFPWKYFFSKKQERSKEKRELYMCCRLMLCHFWIVHQQGWFFALTTCQMHVKKNTYSYQENWNNSFLAHHVTHYKIIHVYQKSSSNPKGISVHMDQDTRCGQVVSF